MKLSDIMSNAGLAIYAEVALVLFAAVFVAIAGWVLRPGAKARWQAAARLPLEDATAVQGAEGGSHHE